MEPNGFPYTKVPNILFEQFLPNLTESELKALLYIIRRTLGFGKLTDTISFSQFLHGITTKDGQVLDHGCGITDRTSLTKALRSLEVKGLIACERTRKGQGRGKPQPTTYTLLLVGIPDQSLVGKPDQSLVGNPDSQKKENIYTYRKNSVNTQKTEEQRQAYFQRFAEENAPHLEAFLRSNEHDIKEN